MQVVKFCLVHEEPRSDGAVIMGSLAAHYLCLFWFPVSEHVAGPGGLADFELELGEGAVEGVAFAALAAEDGIFGGDSLEIVADQAGESGVDARGKQVASG